MGEHWKRTKAQLQADLRTVEALHKQACDLVEAQRRSYGALLAQYGDLRMELDAAKAQPQAAGPALADNIRLAHRAEQAEAKLAQLEAMYELEHARLARFLEDNPHLFVERET